MYYRASTQKEALKLGLAGFVRNEPNGDVYLEAEGTQEQLDSLIKWLWKGPERSVVNDVRIVSAELQNYTNFIIKR